jgi:hypothetical protein
MDQRGSIKERIKQANHKTLEKMLSAQPVWMDVVRAGEAIPGLGKKMLLHAGPPQNYENMCGPQKGAAWGALIFEGLAKDINEADQLLRKGDITIAPAHEHDSVAGAGHMISFSQPVIVLENKTNGKFYYTHMKEDTFVALRYGSYGNHTIKRLKWLANRIAPIFSKGLRRMGGVNCKEIISKSLLMGDEGHNRNQAQTCLFNQILMPVLLEADISKEEILEVAKLLQNDENFFLYPVMASCKAMLDAGMDVEFSTIVTVMARNGNEFGIKVSGLGNRWFTAPAPMVKGLYFPGFTEKDACPDLGDSSITETAGLGGFAMAASPAIVRFGTATGLGGSVQDAINYTKEMYEITEIENPYYQIPFLDFRGCPTGINILKVLDTGIQPIINTSISPKDPGRSQAGAGLVRAPMECFKKAFHAFIERYRIG